MADQVDRSGLILTDWADNMAKMQAQQYVQAQRQREAQDYARARSVEDAANAARQQYAAGDYAGARQTAANGNAWDVWGSIDTTQKAQVAAQASDIGTAAYNLARLPKGQARLDYFASFVPTLKSHGMSDAEIQQYANSGFLDNDDALHGYADKAVGIANLWKADQEKAKAAYDRETDLMKPVTAADGAVLTRGADGSYAPVYTPGTKPMQQIVQNEDGSYSYVNIPGTAGNSYPSGGASFEGRPSEMAGHLSAANLPANVVAGFMGNFAVEGGYGGAQGDGGSAGGVAQWRDERRANFKRVIGVDPAQASMQDQARFVAWEMANPQAAGMTVAQRDAIMAAKSPEEAAALIDQHYERSSGQHRARRVAAARQFAGGAPQGPGPRVNPSSGIQVINLGGGRQGPLWVDETRELNGQMVAGQRNEKTGEFKPLGGAAKASGKVDYDDQIASINNTISLTERLYHHPGLSSVVGVPGVTGGLLFGKVIPGTDAAGFTSLMKNFDANAYLAQVTKMKGMGALSDAEGARLSAAIGSLSTSQSEAEFKDNLARVRKDLELARGRLEAKRRALPGGGSQPQTRVVNGRTYVKVQGGWRAQ